MTKRRGIYKRGGVWYVRIGGKRKSLGPGVRTQEEAQKIRDDLMSLWRKKNLGLLDPKQIKLGQFRKDYVERRTGTELSKATIRMDKLSLWSIAEVLGDACFLSSINQVRIDQWAKVLIQRGTTTQTVNTYLRHIKAALNNAVEAGHLASAPKIKFRRVPTELPRHLEPDEVERLLAAERNFDRRRLWIFCLWTGARRREVVDLLWEDIKLGDKPYARLTGKGRKQRLVPLMPEAVGALGEPQDVGPVFTFMSKGRRRPVAPDTISHWFKKAARVAGLPDARLHDLRHTAATFMISKGVLTRVVQEILGHASITTTERYSKGLVGELYDVLADKLK